MSTNNPNVESRDCPTSPINQNPGGGGGGGQGESLDHLEEEEDKDVKGEGEVNKEGGGESSNENNESSSSTSSSSSVLECPICLQGCMFPIQLPTCGHIFCFLCIKGVAMQGGPPRCAICRAPIPPNLLSKNVHEILKDVSQLYKQGKEADCAWFYEARSGGWWQYDERSTQELEKAFQAGQTSCQLLVAGHVYEIDFPQMIQFRSNNRNLFRRIKRGEVTVGEKRGVAGIRLDGGGEAATGTAGNNDGDSGSGNPRRGTRGNGGNSNYNNNNPSHNQNQVPADGSSGQGQQQQNNDHPLPMIVDFVQVSSDDGEDEGVDSDGSNYLEEDDDEMEFVEEAELEESDEEEAEVRDGARAPTRRSERSNSSATQTPPPRSTSSMLPARPSPSGGLQKLDGKKKSRRSNSTVGIMGTSLLTCNASETTSSSASSPSPLMGEGGSGVKTIRLSPVQSQSTTTSEEPSTSRRSASSASASITTTAGITCLLLGPGVKITVDNERSRNSDEEIL